GLGSFRPGFVRIRAGGHEPAGALRGGATGYVDQADQHRRPGSACPALLFAASRARDNRTHVTSPCPHVLHPRAATRRRSASAAAREAAARGVLRERLPDLRVRPLRRSPGRVPAGAGRVAGAAPRGGRLSRPRPQSAPGGFGTGVGWPSGSRAIITKRPRVHSLRSPVSRFSVITSTSTFIELRPTLTRRAITSTRSPLWIGWLKSTCSERAVTTVVRA